MNKSVYDSPTVSGTIKRHLITVLVDNDPGVLARVVGLFSGRGYNIDSLNYTGSWREIGRGIETGVRR